MFRKMQRLRDCQFLKNVAFVRKSAYINQRYLRYKGKSVFSRGLPADKNYTSF